MLSSEENVVFCNVFLSKISAKSLSKSFWQTKYKKNKTPQVIILSAQSVQASLPSLLLNLKDRRALLTHNLSVSSVLNKPKRQTSPDSHKHLPPPVPRVSPESFSVWLFLATNTLLHPPRGRVPPSLPSTLLSHGNNQLENKQEPWAFC